jgi:type IV pilus assembly protein PilA
MNRLRVSILACAGLALAGLQGCGEGEQRPAAEAAPAAAEPAKATTPAAPAQPGTQAPGTHELSALEQQINQEIDVTVADVQKKVAAGLALAAALKASVEQTVQAVGQIPKTAEELGVRTRDAPPAGQAGPRIEYAEGAIVVTYEPGGGNPGGTVVLRPQARGGAVAWDCRGGSLPAAYRPPECR